jgi:hypothetical protein
MTITRQSTNDTTNLPFIQYCTRVARDSGNTSTQGLQTQTSIESANVYPLTGRNVVLSFYARAGANYSATSSILTATLKSGTTADLNFTSLSTTVATTNATLTTTWQRFSVTGTMGATAISAGIEFLFTPTGTAGANDYFEVTGVQLELGSVATTFSRAGGTIQGELSACQRYYQRFDAATAEPLSANGGSLTTTISQVEVVFPVQLRTAPSSLDSSNVEVLNYGNNTAYSGGTLAINLATKSVMQLRYTHGTAVFTAGNVVHFRSGAGTGYLGWSAEL